MTSTVFYFWHLMDTQFTHSSNQRIFMDHLFCAGVNSNQEDKLSAFNGLPL